MRMLCICAKGDPLGFLAIAGNPLDVTDIAKTAGVGSTEAEILMEELSRWGVFSRDRKGRIYSRRIIRDAKKRQEGKKHGKTGGNPNLCKTKEKPATIKGGDKGEGYTQKLEARVYIEEKYTKEFDEWYAAFPLHKGKGQAVKAYRAARKKAGAETLLAGARRYAGQRAGEDRKFTKHPATWLNGECWGDDEPSEEPTMPSYDDKAEEIKHLEG